MTFNISLQHWRLYCLVLALLTIAASFAFPARQQKGEIYNLTVIVDITRSMNAEDYVLEDKPYSRLEFVKHSLRELIVRLPCRSKIGLGVFTERRSTLLYEPVEVCSAYTELDASIAALDWRMAWAADSRVANGLLSAMQILRNKDTTLVFVSDGHEAPPVNPRYRTDFSEIKGKLKGLIVGTGGLKALAIPKFDSRGRRIGVYGPNDVPQRSSFGVSDLNPEQIEGYDARNAPFGKYAATGKEHLSALKEGYLQQLAAETGLDYTRLQAGEGFGVILKHRKLARPSDVDQNLRAYYGTFALMMLLVTFV